MRIAPRYLPVLAVLLVAGCTNTAVPASAAGPPATTAQASPRVVSPAAPPRITYPAHGHQKWAQAPGQRGGPDGHAGRLFNYRVLVEADIKGVTPAAFASAVQATLAAPQGWTSGGRWRFHRSAPGQPYDFTLYLATPDTRDVLCGGDRDGYTSCRHHDRSGDAVVLNVARWVKGIPAFHGDVALYRRYQVNHEVGHELGMGHMLCPGAGEPAPVMQQQTLGMHGCTPNPWPYPARDNDLYTGVYGTYNDPPQPPDRGNS